MPAPRLGFTLTPLVGDGIPAVKNEAFGMLLSEAVAGGAATGSYLGHMLRFAAFSTYLEDKGESAFTVSSGPDGGQQAVASDGTTTLHVGVTLDPLTASGGGDDPPVRGVATVRLSLPNPYNIVKITQFGLTLASLPPGVVLTGQVWDALMSPLLSRLTSFLRSAIDAWLEADVGDAAAITDSLGTVTADVAGTAAEETAEVVVEEEVVAEVAIDLAAAVPALAGLAALMAVPLLVGALAKSFVVHLEVNNLTDVDLTWSIPYLDEGAVSVQPASPVLPKMGTATDSWGDQTTVSVVYQADYAVMNTSGFEGVGLVVNFTPQGYTGQDTCLVLSVPWLSDNAVWLGDPGPSPDWPAIYAANSGSSGELHAFHGNQRFTTAAAIDALSGNNDEYHCVVRIERL